MTLFSLYRDTLLGLASPRRLVPISLLAVPLIVAQNQLSADSRSVFLGVGMVLSVLFIGPFTWRAFVHRGSEWAWPTRIVGLLFLFVLPFAIGRFLPMLLGLRWTFLTGGVHLFVTTGLFWVGSWGLARDLELSYDLRNAHARAEALALEAEHAQLLALRAHLDPHFLFNTLNAIAEWCREDGEVAERAILDLSSVLREVMGGVRLASWPLSRELAVVRQVLDLHAVRDPERFQYDWDVDVECTDVPVPPLLLLPLVENAVKHGVAKGHSGKTSIRVHREGGVCITLGNPGPFAGPREGGEGLRMVERRLALVYHHASFSIVEREGRTVATVIVPNEGPIIGRRP